MTTRYLTLAYGDSADVYSQSAMLLVSLLAYAPAPCELVVATDRPERFAWFGKAVRLVTLDRRELEAWRGTPPISMRLKLEAIRANWPDSGAMVLVDADVLAREPLDSFEARLRAGDVFMHKHEYELRPVEAARQSRALERAARPLVRRLGGARRRRDVEFRRARGACRGPRAVRSGAAVLRRHCRRRRTGTSRPSSWSRGSCWAAPAACVPPRSGSRTTGETRPAHTAAIDARLAAARSEGLSVEECAARYRQDPIDLPAEVRLTAREKVARWFGAALTRMTAGCRRQAERRLDGSPNPD